MIVTADDILEQTRPRAATLVEREERRTGSKMAAYENIAASVGVGSSWLRKLIGRQPDVKVEAHEYLNITALYRHICERVEDAAERERARAAEIRREIDAALEGDPVLVARMARPPKAGATAEGLEQGTRSAARLNAHPEFPPAAQDTGAPVRGGKGPDEVAVGDRADIAPRNPGNRVAAAGEAGRDGARALAAPAVVPASSAPDKQ